MKRFGLSLVLAGVLAFSVGAAQAFTFTDQNGNTGGGQGYLDLDTKSSRSDLPASRFGTDDKSTLKSGNATIQFGGSGSGGSFNQRYNSNNLFDPYTRDGR